MTIAHTAGKGLIPMAKNIDIYDTFSGCRTIQHVSARIDAMAFQEIRELMTCLGCTIDRLNYEVCRTLGIRKNNQK